MTETASSDPATAEPPAVPIATLVRRRRAALGLAGLLIVIVAAVIVIAGGGGADGPPTGAAALIPSDALGYVHVSLDRSRPAVRQALTVAARFPDFPLALGAVETRLLAIVAGGQSASIPQVSPWLGSEAALALLNTPSSTAGSLIVLDVHDRAMAAGFVRAHGAVAAGSYRGTALLAYRTGLQLAFVSHYLVLGQDASVRAAIDVAGGRVSSLAASGVYQRAAAAEPSGRVLDAYASLAGVRRLLAPQGGVVGAVGSLLYQPALQGVALSLTPTAQGARMQIHSALDPSLTKLSRPATSVFTPTLESVMPSGAILVFDVAGLDRVAPSVLNAGAAAGVAGGLGPLLSRLGTALTAEGVNVKQLTSIFHPETAAAIVPHAGRPALVLVARTRDPAQTRTELAGAEAPLEQLFTPTSSSGPGKVPVFNDRVVGGITAHQLQLANGFELDYAVFRGLVVISTSLDGVAAIADRSHALTSDPGFRFALGARPSRVTALVYLDVGRLLTLGEQTGLTSSRTYQLLRSDLAKVTAVGLSSTRTASATDSELAIHVPLTASLGRSRFTAARFVDVVAKLVGKHHPHAEGAITQL